VIYLNSALVGLAADVIFLALLYAAAKSALRDTDTYFIVFHFNSPVLIFIWLSASLAYFYVSRRRTRSF
jgi:hypothetical protein